MAESNNGWMIEVLKVKFMNQHKMQDRDFYTIRFQQLSSNEIPVDFSQRVSRIYTG